MEKKFIGIALFDDKDIMFDAFMEDITDPSIGFCMNGGYDAVTYICDIPARFRALYKVCMVTCAKDDVENLFQILKNKLDDWNKNQSDSFIRYTWFISRIDNTIGISANKFEITE